MPTTTIFVQMAMLLQPAGRAKGYNYPIKSVSHFQHTLACTRAWLLSFCCLQSELGMKALNRMNMSDFQCLNAILHTYRLRIQQITRKSRFAFNRMVD